MANKPAPFFAGDSVTQYMELSQLLTREAAEYVGAGVFDAETDANIRKLRLLSNALNAALQAAVLSPSPMPPMPPPITAATQPRS